jgi:putative FmdB family regulatory protein
MLDALQKISDDPLVDCPECGEPQLRRQLSAPRFRLKGSGWYETDFKKEKQRNLHGEKEPAKKDEKPAAGKADKGDAKPAAGNKSGVG